MLLKWSLIITGVFFAFLMWQCGSGMYQAMQASDAAIAQFHQLLNQEAYEKIWNDADPDFRNPEKKDETFKFFAAVHRKLGNARSATRGSINVNATTNGTFVRVNYTCTFDKGTAEESYTFKKTLAGDLKLLGYNIQSNAFIVN